ncbi:MAG: type II CAAX endopeptidase family protein [bacterium]|nr:type II CAAX endopeptidase family protein [bacterium]
MTRKSKLFYFGVLPGLLIQLIGAYFYFILFDGASFSQAIYFGVKVLILVWPLTWWLLLGNELLKDGVKNRTNSIKWGLISGLLIAMAILFIFLLSQDFFHQFSSNLRVKAESLGFMKHYLLFAFFLSVVHSLIEEYYWRWFIFRGLLLKLTPVWAAVISSAGFASHHYLILSEFFTPWMTVLFGTAVFIGGLLWCFVYYRTRSMRGIWISHFLVDVSIMTVGYWLLV